MAEYGNLHRVSDFLARTLPKRGKGDFGNLFLHEVIRHLKFLDEVQANNPWVTLAVSASDGIWFSYKGRRIYLTLPGINKLRILVPRDGSKESDDLVETIKLAMQRNGSFRDISRPDYWQWHALPQALAVLEKFVQSLPVSTEAETEGVSHPRNFSGEVRQAILEAFEREGNYCPGVQRKRHRVDRKKERIEFDHILPYSRGGSSSFKNVQVLCQECNRTKRATSR